MSGELQVPGPGVGATVYVLIRDRTARIWSTSGGTGAFGAYSNTEYEQYAISTLDQGSNNYYVGNMPTAIPPGYYNLSAHQQTGGSPLQTDRRIAMGDEQWNGTVLLPLSDLATSGQVGQMMPIRLARGTMIQSFSIYFKSSTDHVTPFTSGVVSGQIARDGGAFGPLQSGAFSETGLGFYRLQSLTSGDLLANTASLLFTANGISGGTADPVPFSLILQRTSGQ